MSDPAARKSGPQITSFQLPPDGLVATALLWSVIPYGAFVSPTAAAGAGSPLLSATQFLHSYVSIKSFKWAFAILVGLHSLESLYTLSLCIKYKASLKTTLAYIVTTFFVGFPTWRDLRKRALAQSVTKNN
ncbi:hypothetical protein B0H16DRAFT_1698410 [Mycena metata]|uniref:DUF2470 domain-containing protein n=1 Tax=Mycena metata TaxID=1033252 RepID=A0AAD7HP72_9AGAR|nr:hypothetical protein B0H16DRAFT_1698410 [Mycena metata]